MIVEATCKIKRCIRHTYLAKTVGLATRPTVWWRGRSSWNAYHDELLWCRRCCGWKRNSNSKDGWENVVAGKVTREEARPPRSEVRVDRLISSR